MSLIFIVHGDPQPAQYGVRRGAHAAMYEKAGSKDWKRWVAAEVARQYDGGPKLVGALRLAVHFYVKRPKGHYGTGRNAGTIKPAFRDAWPTTKPDTTKLLRGVEDALTGLVWRDDAQVVEQWAVKSYVDQTPARVAIEVSSAGVPPHEDVPGRIARLHGAVAGAEFALDVDAEGHVLGVMTMIDPGHAVCLCDAVLDPSRAWCHNCGRPAWRADSPARRAASVPPEPKNPAKSEDSG